MHPHDLLSVLHGFFFFLLCGKFYKPVYLFLIVKVLVTESSVLLSLDNMISSHISIRKRQTSFVGICFLQYTGTPSYSIFPIDPSVRSSTDRWIMFLNW